MISKRVSSKKNERLPLVQSINGIVRITIWNPLGLAFEGKWVRLASVSDPSERDVKVWNSRVLDRMDIDLLGRLAMEGRVRDWIGHG